MGSNVVTKQQPVDEGKLPPKSDNAKLNQAKLDNQADVGANEQQTANEGGSIHMSSADVIKMPTSDGDNNQQPVNEGEPVLPEKPKPPHQWLETLSIDCHVQPRAIKPGTV